MLDAFGMTRGSNITPKASEPKSLCGRGSLIYDTPPTFSLFAPSPSILEKFLTMVVMGVFPYPCGPSCLEDTTPSRVYLGGKVHLEEVNSKQSCCIASPQTRSHRHISAVTSRPLLLHAKIKEPSTLGYYTPSLRVSHIH